MGKRNRDAKDSATKNTLNPRGSERQKPNEPENLTDPGVTNQQDVKRRIGQFTGRGTPGLEKK
jgi:hypothetical protein